MNQVYLKKHAEGMLLVTDINGEILPGQVDLIIRQAVDEMTTVTVTFNLDPRRVMFEDK